MTLDKARERVPAQADFGGFYNSNSAKLMLAEVTCEHGQQAVDRHIAELQLNTIFGFEPGTRFEGGLAVKKDKPAQPVCAGSEDEIAVVFKTNRHHPAGSPRLNCEGKTNVE